MGDPPRLAEHGDIARRVSADDDDVGWLALSEHANLAMALERTQADVVLIVYGSAQKSERSRNLGGDRPI